MTRHVTRHDNSVERAFAALWWGGMLTGGGVIVVALSFALGRWIASSPTPWPLIWCLTVAWFVLTILVRSFFDE